MRSSSFASAVLVGALVAATIAVPAVGQPTEPPAPDRPADGMVAKVFVVRHVDARHVASVLEIFGGAARPQTDLRVVAWGGPADRLAAVEAAVTALDVAPKPARDLVLTAWLVDLSDQPGPGTDLPAPVRAAIERLAVRPSDRGARVLERAVLRVRDDSRNAEVRGRLSNPERGVGSYTLRVRQVELAPGGATPAVRLDGLALQVEVAAPTATGTGEPQHVFSSGLATDVDLPVGNAAAVGATALTSSGRTMILVLQADIAG